MITLAEVRRQNLKRLIELEFKTQKEFCDQSGFSKQYVSNLLNGIANIGNVTATRIEEFLGLDHHFLSDPKNLGGKPTYILDVDNAVDIDDAAEAVITLVGFLHSEGIAMHQYDNEKLNGLLKEIFRDIRAKD